MIPIDYVILVRVSSEKQEKSGAGIAAQLDSCRDFVRKNGGRIVAEIIEEAVSGGTPLDQRPKLMEALATLKKGGVLLVWKRERLFRGDPVSNYLIEQEIRRRGATLRSVAGEGTEGDDENSLFMRDIHDVLARHELRIIRLRTRMALRAKRSRGERTGDIPYGWNLIPGTNRLEENQDEQAIIQQIMYLHSNGNSLRAIVRRLEAIKAPAKKGGKWSAQTVSRVIKRQKDPELIPGNADASFSPAK